MKKRLQQLVFGVGMVVLSGCDQHVAPLPENGGRALPATRRPLTAMPSGASMGGVPMDVSRGGSGAPMSGMASGSAMGNLPPDRDMRGSGGSLSGTITITPDLAARLTGSEILFIIARQGPGGPPTAVKRIQPAKFPLEYNLSAADQMVQGQAFSGVMSLTARIDQDGSAGPPQPGDMDGQVPQAVIGPEKVDIVINKAY